MSAEREVALEYLRRFCAGDIDGLTGLLAPDLNFSGTLSAFHSREDYLAGLRRDPPDECGFLIRSVSEDGDRVAVFYDYEKPAGTITVAQLFRIEGQVIREVLTVFDGRGFAPPGEPGSGSSWRP